MVRLPTPSWQHTAVCNYSTKELDALSSPAEQACMWYTHIHAGEIHIHTFYFLGALCLRNDIRIVLCHTHVYTQSLRAPWMKVVSVYRGP